MNDTRYAQRRESCEAESMQVGRTGNRRFAEMQIPRHFRTAPVLRFVARDVDDPSAALLYWLDVAEPSWEASFYRTTQRFGTLMQVVLPDEQPGVFVNRFAIHTVVPAGCIKRLIFLDDSWLEIRYGGNCDDLCNLHAASTHTCP
ncbi:hypothetical protein [Paraburkholderia sartisoli]|nr:hypothetical protein [Paraburkholderia sartisoli]